MTKIKLPPLSAAAQAFLRGAGYWETFQGQTLPEPQLRALAERAEIVAKEVQTQLDPSGAGRDLNRAYRALRLNGDVTTSYGKFRAAKIAELALAMGKETARRTG